jgi:hypothetical protein
MAAEIFSRKEKAMAKAKTSAKTVAKKGAVKTVAKKTVAKKIAVKKTAVKATAKKTAGMKKGNRYSCVVCGLAVTVDTACGCPETAHLVCCETPMRMKK